MDEDAKGGSFAEADRLFSRLTDRSGGHVVPFDEKHVMLFMALEIRALRKTISLLSETAIEMIEEALDPVGGDEPIAAES